MSNAAALRDAVFVRARAVKPQGFPDWVVARTVTVPTLASTFMPLLQVTIGTERMVRLGDENIGPMQFGCDLDVQVTVMRGMEDPIVLSGQADTDLTNILDALFTDNSFTNPELQVGFVWESVLKIDIAVRQNVESPIEMYAFIFTANVTFRYNQLFEPPAPHWLEEIGITAKLGPEGTTVASALVEVGTLRYTVEGPTTAVHGVPSGQFNLFLEPGASFTALQTIILSDGGAGGTFTPSFGAAGIGACAVQPQNNAVFFSFVYTPAASGTVTITFLNSQGWTDAAPVVLTVT